MMRPRMFFACLVVMLLGGCATLGRSTPDAGDVEAAQEHRREDVVRVFEEKRDYAQLQAALARWQSGDVKGCREQLEKLMARNPKHPEAQLLLADLMLFEQQPDQAIQQLKQTLAENPSNARAQHTMGLVLEANGQTDEALPYFQRATELEQTNELFALSYQTAQDASRMQAENPADPQKEPSGADWSEVTANAAVRQMLAEAGAALAAGNVRAAHSLFVQAAAKEPENPHIPLRAAILSLRHEHPEMAVEMLTPAAERFRDSAALFRVLGTAHYRLGDYRAAQLALQQAISLDKSNPLAYFLMGCTLKKLGQPEAADRHFEQARGLSPSFAVSR